MKRGFAGIAGRITETYLILLITLYLFFVGNGGYTSIVRAKYALLITLTALYLAALAATALLKIARGELELPRLRDIPAALSPAQRFTLLYMLLAWVSALASPFFPHSVLGASRHEGAVTLSIYCIIFLLVSAFAKPGKSLLCIFASAVLALAVLCALQLFGLNPFGLYPEGMNYYDAYVKYSGEYLGSIGNADLVAAFFCLAVPILCIGALRLPGRGRCWLLLPLAAALAVMAASGVLAGLVGVFCGGALLLPFVLPMGQRGRRRLAAALAAAGMTALALIWAFDCGGGLLHELHELLRGRWSPDFGSGRLHIWTQVLGKVPQRPLLGWGPDTMALMELEGFERYDEGLGLLLRAGIDTAHNEYLNVLYHQGLLGLAAYAALIVSVLVSFLRRGREDPAAMMLFGAVICYCVQAFFGFSMCVTAPYFWVCLALLEARLRPQAYA